MDEQIAVQDCWQEGRWRDKMMMCRGENRRFERCYIMQSVGWALQIFFLPAFLIAGFFARMYEG